MQISEGGMLQTEETSTAKACEDSLVCSKASKEAHVAGVKGVRVDEIREVSGVTGLSSPVRALLF